MMSERQAQRESINTKPIISWTQLQTFNSFRLLTALLLLSIANLFSDSPLGGYLPLQFQLSLWLYIGICLASSLLAYRLPITLQSHLYLLCYVDILCITLLLHTSGGISSGLGVLMIVSLVTTALITAEQTVMLLAALGTLALLTEQIYTELTQREHYTDYLQSGLLGGTLFITTLLALGIARKNRVNAAMIARHKQELKYMSALNQEIVRGLEIGILFVNNQDQIDLMNPAAARLLAHTNPAQQIALADLSKAMHEQLRQWQRRPVYDNPFIIQLAHKEYSLKFTTVNALGTLIEVSDLSTIKQQLLQLKLASLGRLTANIAHEIRNPLGAISHAAQLMEESEQLHEGDARLLRIVNNNSRRINRIIEDVMGVSRINNHQFSHIHLAAFTDELHQTHHNSSQITQQIPDNTGVICDPDHLNQIMTNLINNAFHHNPATTNLRVTLCANTTLGKTVLAIRDNGCGISPEQQEKIFEPFYTTRNDGSGLGLYITKELCSYNHIDIACLSSHEGTCFELTFNQTSLTGVN